MMMMTMWWYDGNDDDDVNAADVKNVNESDDFNIEHNSGSF